jgi:hypothetical protein
LLSHKKQHRGIIAYKLQLLASSHHFQYRQQLHRFLKKDEPDSKFPSTCISNMASDKKSADTLPQ